jgi:hypothetical protein
VAAVGATRIHQASDQTSAEVMAGRLRAEGIPAEIVRADAGPPYRGFGMSTAYDILVPEHVSRKARRALGIDDVDRGVDRRGYYALVVLVVLVVLAVVVFVLGLMQRAG